MIKHYIFIVFILVGIVLNGQSSSSRFTFLAHAGLAGSQVQGDGLGGFDKLNMMFGIGVESEFKSEHAMGFEINMVQKGSKRNPNPEINDLQKYKMSLVYIQVPLYFNYRFSQKISALAGPGFGFLVSSKEENLDGEIPVDPEFNDIEFSAILGVQYWISDRFRAEVRFDQSILPIRTKDNGATSEYLVGRQYNTSLGVYACFILK